MTTHVREIQLTERDYALFRGLFESRIMTLTHAAALLFDGSVEAAKKRIQQLKRAAYVRERPRDRPYDPSVLYLGRRGYDAIRRAGRIADYPAIGWETMEKRAHVSPFTLQHELDVMSTKAAMVSALRGDSRYRVVEFSTWPRLFAFKTHQQTRDGYGHAVMMRPDAFIRIDIERGDDSAPRQSSLFLELDRSTETQQNLRARASGYLDYYRSGDFAKRYGFAPEHFRQLPFQVLWIFQNAERRNNAAESFLRHHPPVLTMAWLTTFDELVKNPFGRYLGQTSRLSASHPGHAFRSNSAIPRYLLPPPRRARTIC